MSSISVSYSSRKRVHNPVYRDSSSSSTSEDEDEAPAVKIKRSDSRPSNFPVAITARLKNLVVWMSALPVKEYFQMAIKAGASLPPETINIDDEEEEEEEEVCIDEDVIRANENPFLRSLQHSRKLLLSDKHCSRQLETNGSCSTRSKARALTYTQNPHFGTSASVNGRNYRNWDIRRSGNGSYNFRQQQTECLKRSAIVSNPETDIEILLETKPEETVLEGDEIEILSESPNIKQKPRSFQRISSQSTRAAVTKGSTSHPSSSQSEKSAVIRSQSSKSKQYTAHQVVRLQEKAQYQLLLDKYIRNNLVASQKKLQSTSSTPELEPKSEDDANLTFSKRYNRRDILQQPVAEFIKKYYRPCQSVLPDKNSKSSNNKESDEAKDDKKESDEDDEIQIIDIRLPKYKPKYRQKPDFFSADWIAELKTIVEAQTEERMKIVQEHEEVIERFRRERLLKKLSIDGQGSAESSEPEFPELTPEMEEEIERALHGGKPDERLCKITSDYLLRKDIETLDGLSWLNDLVINSYFDLIVERSKQEGYPSVYAYNTFFYSTYKAKRYPSVRRWTRKIDIFSYDLNFVPLHLGVHWCLAVIDHRSKKICYYDSMGNGEEVCLDLLHEYLCLEYKDKKGQMLDPSIYVTEVMKDIPLQMNGSDCGMFTLKYAEYISRDAEITFNQTNMCYFRRRMVYELLHNQLL